MTDAPNFAVLRECDGVLSRGPTTSRSQTGNHTAFFPRLTLPSLPAIPVWTPAGPSRFLLACRSSIVLPPKTLPAIPTLDPPTPKRQPKKKVTGLPPSCAASPPTPSLPPSDHSFLFPSPPPLSATIVTSVLLYAAALPNRRLSRACLLPLPPASNLASPFYSSFFLPAPCLRSTTAPQVQLDAEALAISISSAAETNPPRSGNEAQHHERVTYL